MMITLGMNKRQKVHCWIILLEKLFTFIFTDTFSSNTPNIEAAETMTTTINPWLPAVCNETESLIVII